MTWQEDHVLESVALFININDEPTPKSFSDLEDVLNEPLGKLRGEVFEYTANSNHWTIDLESL